MGFVVISLFVIVHTLNLLHFHFMLYASDCNSSDLFLGCGLDCN